MKSKRCFFTVADVNNQKYARGLENSFKKFHPDVEFRIFGMEEIKQTNDPMIFYRATPYFGLYLMNQGYDTVVKLDADQVIIGDISHVWEGGFDIATVNNSNPREFKKIAVGLQGINPKEYQNCGFVVMKNIEFVKLWLALCMSGRFNVFQYKEQDILNNIIYWGTWKVRFLDNEENNKLHGLAGKGYELQMELRDDKLYLPPVEGYPDVEKQVVCWHEAGGNVPNKMNYYLKFNHTVARWMKQLIK